MLAYDLKQKAATKKGILVNFQILLYLFLFDKFSNLVLGNTTLLLYYYLDGSTIINLRGNYAHLLKAM